MSTTTTTEITSSDDVIDVRDVIARVEFLEQLHTERVGLNDVLDNCEREELATLTALLEDLEGNGGDEEWRGSWYPVTLIRESYFQDYARELAEDIGAINRDAEWPNNCIDWEAAANALLVNYTSTEFKGVTYYYR